MKSVASILKDGALAVLDRSKHRGHDVWRDLIFSQRQLGVTGDCVLVDVGANIGQTAIELAKNFPSARVLSFEPVHETFVQLKYNTRNLLKVEPVKAGLGSANARHAIYHQSYSTVNSLLRTESDVGSSEQIDIKTFGTMRAEQGFDRAFLLKSDTEGYDVEVLRGAEEALNSKRLDFILIETRFFRKMDLPQSSFFEVAELLQNFDYHLVHTYEHVYASKGGKLLGATHYFLAGEIMKNILKYWLSKTPYRIVRHLNRFSATEETLLNLKSRGFLPGVVVDGGANIGGFTQQIRKVYGNAPVIHMFEPQPACADILQQITKGSKSIFHQAALGSSSGKILAMVVDPAGWATPGAHITLNINACDAECTVSVPVLSLDHVFATSLHPEDRALLKLDLQGWEMEALLGATAMLSSVEVAVVEASFFAQAYEPSVAELIRHFDESGFDLHDIAGIWPRLRDNRAHQADLIFVNRKSHLAKDVAWS